MDKVSYGYMMGSASRRALYTGVTAYLRKRTYEHKHDLVEGFSRQYKCHRLVFFERFENIKDAHRSRKGNQGLEARKEKQAC